MPTCRGPNNATAGNCRRCSFTRALKPRGILSRRILAIVEYDSAVAGLEKAKRWLARYEPPPIDPALDEALRNFVARREREIPASLT